MTFYVKLVKILLYSVFWYANSYSLLTKTSVGIVQIVAHISIVGPKPIPKIFWFQTENHTNTWPPKYSLMELSVSTPIGLEISLVKIPSLLLLRHSLTIYSITKTKCVLGSSCSDHLSHVLSNYVAHFPTYCLNRGQSHFE